MSQRQRRRRNLRTQEWNRFIRRIARRVVNRRLEELKERLHRIFGIPLPALEGPTPENCAVANNGHACGCVGACRLIYPQLRESDGQQERP
jgi:hypothetical protein